MLENPTLTASDSAAAVKRYAPPNQRNRSVNRRKSGDRFDRNSNINGIDADKSQSTVSRNIPIVNLGEAGGNDFLNGNSRPTLIAIEGCCRSEASRLLSDRWAAAMHLYNDTSVDLSDLEEERNQLDSYGIVFHVPERPVIYSGSSESAWRNFGLPHQIMSPTNSSGPSSGSQMDFLGELRRSIRNANASLNN